MQDLNRTCKEMQSRIAHLIGSITNENTIGELLRINDDLNNVFLRYEQFESSLTPQVRSPAKTPAAASSQNIYLTPQQIAQQPISPNKILEREVSNAPSVNLIDFGNDEDLTKSSAASNKNTSNNIDAVIFKLYFPFN